MWLQPITKGGWSMVAAIHPASVLWWWFAHGWNINRRTYEPRTREPHNNNVVGGVWWWLWWHIVGLSINKPNAQMNLLVDP